jgi:hypothetical protein
MKNMTNVSREEEAMHGIIEHTHYPPGQIVLIKKILLQADELKIKIQGQFFEPGSIITINFVARRNGKAGRASHTCTFYSLPGICEVFSNTLVPLHPPRALTC